MKLSVMRSNWVILQLSPICSSSFVFHLSISVRSFKSRTLQIPTRCEESPMSKSAGTASGPARSEWNQDAKGSSVLALTDSTMKFSNSA